MKLVTVVFAVAASALAQTQTPMFDAVSIRINRSGSLSGGVGPQGAGIRATNNTTRSLISWAWGLNSYELTGGPDWLNSDRYDIVATSTLPPDVARTRAMTQAMLADRFQLVLRREVRPMPAYALVVARADRRLGRGLRVSTVDCDQPKAFCGSRIDTRTVESRGLTLEDFAKTMAGRSGRYMINRTGLEGRYDIDLTWDPDPGAPGTRTDLPSIFGAIEEQLGLKVEPVTGDVPVFIIERVERPTEN